jgi:hypothetical protein
LFDLTLLNNLRAEWEMLRNRWRQVHSTRSDNPLPYASFKKTRWILAWSKRISQVFEDVCHIVQYNHAHAVLVCLYGNICQLSTRTLLHHHPVASISRDRRLEISYLRFSACYEDRNTTIRFRNKRSTSSKR